MNSKKAGEGVGLVEDEKIITISAFDFFDGEIERVIKVEVIYVFIEILGGAVGFFNFESIESFGVDHAEDFILIINEGEISKAGFIEFIENEGAEDFGVFNENHIFFRNHEIPNRAAIKAHNGSDAVAIFGT